MEAAKKDARGGEVRKQERWSGWSNVCEVYSPPRIRARASKYGLKKGWSLDLKTNNEKGEARDSSDPRMRQEAERKVRRERPTVLVASPVCEAFNTTQDWINANVEPDEVRRRIQYGLSHLQFAMDLCKVKRAGTPCSATRGHPDHGH